MKKIFPEEIISKLVSTCFKAGVCKGNSRKDSWKQIAMYPPLQVGMKIGGRFWEQFGQVYQES